MDPIRRAERTKALLENEQIAEAKQAMHDSLTRAMWRRGDLPADQQAKLDAYVHHFQAFWGYFERAIADGKVAEADLKQKSTLRRTSERLLKAI